MSVLSYRWKKIQISPQNLSNICHFWKSVIYLSTSSCWWNWRAGHQKFFEPNLSSFFPGNENIHTTSIYLKYECIYVYIDHTSLRKPDLKKRFLHSPTKKTWHKKSFTYSKKMNLDIVNRKAQDFQRYRRRQSKV